MVGNVWEWTSSLWGKDWNAPEFKYPYDPRDGRENLEAGDEVRRVLRGGAFNNNRNNARCAYRNRNNPNDDWNNNGFRIVVSHILLTLAGNVIRLRPALSGGEGAGSTFTVTLPLTTPDASTVVSKRKK